jgi:NitT/TauT family transport system substrate-binding protein
MKSRSFASIAVSMALSALLTTPLRAEVSEVNAAKQYGLGYLQLVSMEDGKLVEKHAKAAGLGDIAVTWSTFRSSDVMNDALLSGQVHFVSLGIPGLATIWAKTRGNIDVRGATGLNAAPLLLVTRNPRIRSLKDFTEKDRIVLPAVKVSNQAILLQMAAAREFGEASWAKLDPLTVSMAHPDALTALLSGGGEIDSYFSSPPFQYKALAQPGIRTILNSYDILGGKTSFNAIATTAKFRRDNPKIYAAYLAALKEATEAVNADKAKAIEAYVRVTKDKTPTAELLAMLNDPDIEFTQTPLNVLKTVDFMHKTGAIKLRAESWKELYFENMHGAAGS